MQKLRVLLGCLLNLRRLVHLYCFGLSDLIVSVLLPKQQTETGLYHRIVGKEGDFLRKLIDKGGGKLEWQAGTVLSPVESLIQAAGLGGSARCDCRLPHNPFYSQTISCTLEVKSEAQQHFPGPTQEQISLFNPPMSEQVTSLGICVLASAALAS